MTAAAVVVAHPDDETIFFGATIAGMIRTGWSVDVICVTGTFTTGTATAIRRTEFTRACWRLGAKGHLLGLPDVVGGGLDRTLLNHRLGRVDWSRYRRVYTHGVWGEYGHPHHVQVCRAMHRIVPGVRSLAGPFPPVDRRVLTEVEFAAKQAVASWAYASQPFAADWCTVEEAYTCFNRTEVEYLTAVALGEAPPAGPFPEVRPTTARFPDVAHIPAQLWQDGHRTRVGAVHKGQSQNGASAPRTDFSK